MSVTERKPVDVLAAIDLGQKAIGHLCRTDTLMTRTETLTPSEASNRLHEARAAVAELIEAMREIEQASRGGTPILMAGPVGNLARRALARVGGA